MKKKELEERIIKLERELEELKRITMPLQQYGPLSNKYGPGNSWDYPNQWLEDITKHLCTNSGTPSFSSSPLHIKLGLAEG